jgi:hypothetical protein
MSGKGRNRINRVDTPEELLTPDRIASIERDASLAEPRNFRRVERRICANCRFFRMEAGYSSCLRPNGPEFDNGDWEWFWHTCDGWAE